MVREVVAGVYDIPDGMVHAYLVAESDLALIDSGYPGSLARVTEGIARLGKQPTDLKEIVITHYHVDHTGNLAALQRASGATTYVHPRDAPYVRGEAAHERLFPRGIADRLIAPIWARRTARVKRMLEAAAVDREVADGEVLPIGDGLKVIHTPGHTLGHISLLMLSRKVLFVGDAAANVFGLRAPIGTLFGLATADIVQAKESMRKLAMLEFDVACFGHGAVLKGQAHRAFQRCVEKLAR